MKIVAFSDTHGHHRELNIPQSDMLLFAGDLMTCGYKIYELKDFLKWFEKQDATYKIMIAGNHDRLIENNPVLFQTILKSYPSIIYLENSGVEIEGIKIWGTPDSIEFCNWAFNRAAKQLENIFNKIPNDTNILISHAPCLGIGDMLEDGTQVGEATLTNKVEELIELKLHIFGHIHSSYDEYAIGRYWAYNCSVVSEQYYLKNEPHIINFSLLPKEQEDEVSDTTKMPKEQNDDQQK